MSHYFINPGELGSGCSNWYVFHFPFFVPACLWNRRLNFNDILSRPFSLRGAQVAISGAAGKTNDDTVQYLSRRQSSVLTGRCTAWLLNVAVSLCDDGRRWRSLRVEVWLCVCARVCVLFKVTPSLRLRSWHHIHMCKWTCSMSHVFLL